MPSISADAWILSGAALAANRHQKVRQVCKNLNAGDVDNDHVANAVGGERRSGKVGVVVGSVELLFHNDLVF